MENIETGVDKLVDLVASEKKISVDDAAKKLGVSTLVVQEWADFLEEEGLISLEYTLSKVFLVERRLSKKEVASKEKDYTTQKDAFVRKVENALQKLDSEMLGFDKVKTEFEGLKKQLQSELGSVQQDLQELKHYEDLKKSIDEDIKRQRDDYSRFIEASRREIKNEENHYEKILTDLHQETEALTQERGQVKSLLEEEDRLKNSIGALNDSLSNVRNKIEHEKDVINDSDKRLEKLQKIAMNIEGSIKDKKDSVIGPLIRLSEEHRQKVLRLQDDLLEKVTKRKEEIDTFSKAGTEAANEFEKWVGKRTKIDSLMEQIEKEKGGLHDAYAKLITKAHAFDLAKGQSLKTFTKDLNTEFKRSEVRQGKLKSQIQQLVTEIKKH